MPFVKANLSLATATLSTNLSNPATTDSELADNYHKLGVQQYNENQFENSIKSFQEELKYRVKISPGSYSSLLIFIASIYTEKLDHKSEEYKSLILNFKELNGEDLLLKLILEIHIKFISIPNLDLAIEYLSHGFSLCSNLSSETKNNILHLLLCDCVNELDNKENSVEIINKVEAILNKVAEKDASLELADAYHKLAVVRIRQKLYFEGLMCCHKELKMRIVPVLTEFQILYDLMVATYVDMICSKGLPLKMLNNKFFFL